MSAPGARRWPPASDERAEREWQRIVDGRKQLAKSAGLEVHAGHGLDYETAETIAALPQIVELNIGHFMMGEAVFVGLAQTVKEMRAAMDRGRARADPESGPVFGSARQQRMIIGIGSDLIDIRRVEKVIERHGERFLGRIFTDTERARAERRSAKRAAMSRPMPSGLPPRRPAPRRSAPASARACGGGTWASSTCGAASRPWR